MAVGQQAMEWAQGSPRLSPCAFRGFLGVSTHGSSAGAEEEGRQVPGEQPIRRQDHECRPQAPHETATATPERTLGQVTAGCTTQYVAERVHIRR